MTTRTLLTTAAGIALALVASAPAIAGGRSVIATEVYGDDNDIDVCARNGAYWGVYSLGNDHAVTGCVDVDGNQIVTGSLDRGTTTHVDVHGVDNQIGTQARSGGEVDAFVRGHRNEMALRAANGSYVSGRVFGSGNVIRAETR
ncbi:hypothetical protein [Methylorubrum sp. GM97]|uniref:hypothetical protein n=1 Tax=Methylorubrum sp. GM97 TaxID=2938232 RepID=UPI00218B9B6A|nr:hypothetical protein [Methylorubrum sp. GM97]BDL38614.1 hypothetical protein MSPGM_12040 [Methylorubrum sp. GM97]